MSSKKILVVEDEWLVAQGIRENLGDLGYEVVGQAARGEEALRLAAEHRPDLVLMDILLQGDMDGIEAASQLRQRFEIPVVFLTAYADPRTLERAKVTEPYGYLLKPFEVRELHSVVEVALYKAQAEKRLQHLNRILYAIRNVNQLIVEEKDRGRLIERACQLLAEGRGYFGAWIALLDKQGRVTAATVDGEGYNINEVMAALGQGDLPPCALRALDRKDLVVVDDLAQHCPEPAWVPNHKDHGALVTRLAHQEVTYGLLGVQLPSALTRDEEEISLFRELAADLSLALYKMDLEDRERLALEALRVSENRYRSLVDGLPVGIYQRTIGADNRILVANPALKGMFGYDLLSEFQEAGSGATYADSEQRQQFNGQLESTGWVAGMELDLLKKDGTVFPARVWAQLQGSEDALHIEGVIVDITEQRQAQAALEESLSLLRATLDATADGILVVDLQGRIVSHNQRFREMWGLPADIIDAREDDRALAFVLNQLDDPKTFLEKVRRLYTQPTAESFDILPFKDGRVFERVSKPQYLDGQVVGRVWSFRDVTTRVQAEAALRQNEATLQTLFRAAPIGLGLVKNRIFAMVNEQMTLMTGYSMEELIGQSARLIYPNDAEFERVGRQKFAEMRERGIGSLETVWRHKDGSLHDILLSSSPIDLADKHSGIIFTALDISARKRDEAALVHAKESWELTFNTIPDLIAILDPEHQIIQANIAMAACLQAHPPDCVGLKCHQVVHGLDYPPDYCPHTKAMRDGKTHCAELHLEKLGGDFLVTSSPFLGPEGEIIGGVHMARDITERNRAEAELRQYRDHLEQLVGERTAELSREIADHKNTEKALRDSEARFRAIFEEAPIGIVLRDPAGCIVASNPALERILGYSIAELNGADRCYHFFDFSNHIDKLHQELADGQRNFFVVEGRSFDKAGRPVWGRVHASRVRARDDQTWFTLSLIEDITREKENQAEIIAYQERLRALAAELTMTEERERRRLATDLHDNIGQVLALLQIRLGSLRHELPSPKMAADLDEARTLLSQIIASTRSLTLEMGLPVLHELGFPSGVEWLGEKFHKQYGLKVEVNCEPLPGYIDSARETFLFRAVRELLNNVGKHAQARRVSIRTRAANGEFILEVADDGIGFEVSRLSEVAGFGLFSIAERISNQGGSMEVTSAPGQGTMVTITFGQPQAPGDG